MLLSDFFLERATTPDSPLRIRPCTLANHHRNCQQICVAESSQNDAPSRPGVSHLRQDIPGGKRKYLSGVCTSALPPRGACVSAVEETEAQQTIDGWLLQCSMMLPSL